VINQITLTGTVPANSFIFSEATAEAALGYDFFLSNAAAVPGQPAASNTIDGAGSQPTYSAANAAVTFTENAGTPNTTTITSFTADDRIVVQGANSGYSFSNNGSDLVISFANNGVINQITLQGAINQNAFVFNEASAEAAIGADFFRYA
jgi:hypothetical protein